MIQQASPAFSSSSSASASPKPQSDSLSHDQQQPEALICPSISKPTLESPAIIATTPAQDISPSLSSSSSSCPSYPSDKGTSSPCSPTSTTHLATPEWASPDLSCRSYLSQISLTLCECPKQHQQQSLQQASSASTTTSAACVPPAPRARTSSYEPLDVINPRPLRPLPAHHVCEEPSASISTDSADPSVSGDETRLARRKTVGPEPLPYALSTRINYGTSNNKQQRDESNSEDAQTRRALWTKRSLSMSGASQLQQQQQQQQMQPATCASQTLEEEEEKDGDNDGSSTFPSFPSYSSFSFGRLSSSFGVKKQRKQEPLNKQQEDEKEESDATTALGNNNNNRFCSECNAYRAFSTRAVPAASTPASEATDSIVYVECVQCHTVSRRRLSTSSTSLLNTFYTSFPSIGDAEEEEENADEQAVQGYFVASNDATPRQRFLAKAPQEQRFLPRLMA